MGVWQIFQDWQCTAFFKWTNFTYGQSVVCIEVFMWMFFFETKLTDIHKNSDSIFCDNTYDFIDDQLSWAV